MTSVQRIVRPATMILLLACSTLAVNVMPSTTAEEPTTAATGKSDPAERTAARAALEPFNSLIGTWRGVGQPKRNSNRGAWRETLDAVWEFREAHTAVQLTSTDGTLFSSAKLTYDPTADQIHLRVRYPEDTQRDFTGRFALNRFIAESMADDDGYVYRTTLTLLNADRTLILFERRRESQSFFSRIAQIGYTREGVTLAVAGAGDRECVVTGGKGTMKVMHDGKTYYVCCTGCRQAFEDDPVGIIKEYRERLAERKAGRK